MTHDVLIGDIKYEAKNVVLYFKHLGLFSKIKLSKKSRKNKIKKIINKSRRKNKKQ